MKHIKNSLATAFVSVACLMVLCGSAATAATLTLDLQVNAGGTFELYASTSPGDNFGILTFNIDLVNILTATHQSPTGFDLGLSAAVGFSGARSDLSGDGALFAYQDMLNGSAPANLIYGIGQTAGTRSLLGTTGVPWTAPVKLATGTWDTQGPDPWFGDDVLANVFTQEWTTGPLPAGLVAAADEVVLIPEPATLGLLLIGGSALLRRRR